MKARITMDTTRIDGFIARPRRAVWAVSAPIMASMVLHVAYHVADTAFVGSLGAAQLAGITLVFPLLFVLAALANGIGSGITVLVAQAVGRSDAAEAERISGTALSFGISGGLALSLVGVLLGPEMLTHLGATGPVLTASWDYFFVVALGAPITLCSAFIRSVLVGQGDTRTPMFIMAISTLVNVALDPLFIFTFGFGIRGAAIATVIAMSVGLIALVFFAMRPHHNVIRLHLGNFVPQWQPIRAVLVIGIPASLTQLTMAFGMMLINRVVASFGRWALAGYGAAQRIDAIVALPLLGLAAGAVTVVGMFAGANRVDLVRRAAADVIKSAAAIGAILGLGCFLARDLILGIFTDAAPALVVGREYLGFMVFMYPLMGLGMSGGRLLLGLGYPSLSLLMTVIRVLLIGVPFAYIAVYRFHTGIHAIWWGILLGSAIGATVAMSLVRQVIWKRDPTIRAR